MCEALVLEGPQSQRLSRQTRYNLFDVIPFLDQGGTYLYLQHSFILSPYLEKPPISLSKPSLRGDILTYHSTYPRPITEITVASEG